MDHSFAASEQKVMERIERKKRPLPTAWCEEEIRNRRKLEACTGVQTFIRTAMARNPKTTEDDASYWDLLPPEICDRILRMRYFTDWKHGMALVLEEMRRLPRCAQHGTVSIVFFLFVVLLPEKVMGVLFP